MVLIAIGKLRHLLTLVKYLRETVAVALKISVKMARIANRKLRNLLTSIEYVKESAAELPALHIAPRRTRWNPQSFNQFCFRDSQLFRRTGDI